MKELDEFDKDGIHKITGTRFDEEGYDREGFGEDGFDKSDWNRKRIRRDGKSWEEILPELETRKNDRYTFYKYNGRWYTKNGFTLDGFSIAGCLNNVTKQKYNIYGVDKERYDRNGFLADAPYTHKKTQEIYDEEGYDRTGYNKQGYNREGKDKDGKTLEEKITWEKMKKQRIKEARKLVAGEISIDEFLSDSEVSMKQITMWAKENKFPADAVRKLQSLRYYDQKANREEIVGKLGINIDGEFSVITEDDYDKCERFLNQEKRVICYNVMLDTVKNYKQGKLELPRYIEEKREKTELDEKLEEKERLQKEQQRLQDLELLKQLFEGKNEKIAGE